jgi:acetyl esterase/lipase
VTGRSIFKLLLLLSATVLAGGETAAAGEFKATYGETYVERDSGPLKADIYLPEGDGPFPGVLVVHGGAWRMGTRGQLSGVAQMLAKNGFTAVAIS